MASSVLPFQLPRDGRIYIEQIIERCTALIQCGIWGDINPSLLRTWMKNFTSDEERYFAACVLDSLIYRSKSQTLGLIKQLFQRALPDLTRQKSNPLGHIQDWERRLHLHPSMGDPEIRLVAAVKSTDPPGKSAQVIIRYMMQDLSIPRHWIINPWEMKGSAGAGVKMFILVDDFLGTGDQFEGTVLIEQIAPLFASNFVVYAPLTAHIAGIKHLRSRFRELHISPVEVLDETYDLFHSDSGAFGDQVNTPEGAKAFYYELLKNKGIDLSRPERKGYGELGLAYAFEHATPDNSLPILWWREAPWQPLFKHRV